MTEPTPAFESLGGETMYDGRIFSVRRERFRHADGEEVERDFVVHGGAVGIIAYDEEHVWLVRQPREPVGRDDILEIPAGRLDVEGEAPLDAAKRELAEELGLAAADWASATSFFTGIGFTNEQVHLFYATGLSQVPIPETDEDERIEVVRWPLAELDAAIEATVDSKTLIGLMLLARSRAAG